MYAVSEAKSGRGAIEQLDRSLEDAKEKGNQAVFAVILLDNRVGEDSLVYRYYLNWLESFPSRTCLRFFLFF